MIMKRIPTLLLLLVACLTMQAQVDLSPIKNLYESDFTPQFMGIPVDGTKTDMIDAIKAKGFKYDQEYGFFTGEFNGKSVHVFIHTNHDVVDRIMVAYPSISEKQIKTEYNSLLRQFQRNAKYIEIFENEPIPESENISYEMTVHHKDYQSVFFYLPSTISIPALSKATKELIISINQRFVEIEDTLESKFNQLTNQVLELIDNNYTILKNYIDEKYEELDYKIEHISIDSIVLRDPTTGLVSNIQVVINNLFNTFNTDALTASEFDALDLTATAFENYQITAYEFDTQGKIILV